MFQDVFVSYVISFWILRILWGIRRPKQWKWHPKFQNELQGAFGGYVIRLWILRMLWMSRRPKQGKSHPKYSLSSRITLDAVLNDFEYWECSGGAGVQNIENDIRNKERVIRLRKLSMLWVSKRPKTKKWIPKHPDLQEHFVGDVIRFWILRMLCGIRRPKAWEIISKVSHQLQGFLWRLCYATWNIDIQMGTWAPGQFWILCYKILNTEEALGEKAFKT